MRIFPGFGSWISKNSQQPLKVSLYHQSEDLRKSNGYISTFLFRLLMQAESKRSENVESKSVSEKDTNNNAPSNKKKKEYVYDEKEEMRQHILWYEEEKKHPWHNPPPKVKVRKKISKQNIIPKIVLPWQNQEQDP